MDNGTTVSQGSAALYVCNCKVDSNPDIYMLCKVESNPDKLSQQMP